MWGILHTIQEFSFEARIVFYTFSIKFLENSAGKYGKDERLENMVMQTRASSQVMSKEVLLNCLP